jgi:hypothetical protein
VVTFHHNMLLILGAIGIGAVAGWSLSHRSLSVRGLLFSLVALAVLAIESWAISHQISTILLSAAMIASFALRFILLSFLGARAAAQP